MSKKFPIVSSKSHKKHNPATEFLLGRLQPYQECGKRIDNIIKAAISRNIISRDSDLISATDHGLNPILKLHKQPYIDYLKSAYSNWLSIGGSEIGVFPDVFPVRGFNNEKRLNAGGLGGEPGYYCFDFNSIIVEGTFEAAYDAVQVALTASDILMEDDNTHVLALCRPPGHHAEADLCGGYCFFNNAAIAAKYLIDDLNVGKVAILDIDYHHGNGTQNMFYNVSNPFYCSIHGDPDYPYYWGSADEDGEGEGKGFTKNIPLPKGTGDEVYLKNLAEALHIIKNYNPKVVVVSVGLDTFELDPIGCFKLTSNCYREIGDLIKKFFFGEVKLLFVLEGGYAIDQIGLNLMNIFESF